MSGATSKRRRGLRKKAVTGGERVPTRYVTIRQGIMRNSGRGRIASSLPINDRHRAVLAVLTDEPQSDRAIGAPLGLTRGSANSALYALQDRGLATRVPYRGWTR